MKPEVVEAILCLAVVGASCVYVLAKGSPRFLATYLQLAIFSALIYCTGNLASVLFHEPQAYWLSLLTLYIGLMGTVTFWWLATLNVAQHYQYVSPSLARTLEYIALLALAGLVAILVTNPWHGLFLEPQPGSLSLYGPFWYVNALVLWSFIIMACVLAGYSAYQIEIPADRRTLIALALAMLLPGVLNSLYVFGFAGFEDDPTALGLAVSSTIFVATIFRGPLYLLSGVRIDQFMDNFNQPGLLVDRNFRLVYMNAPALSALGELPIHTRMIPILEKKLTSPSGAHLTIGGIESGPSELLQVNDAPDEWKSISAQPIMIGQKRVGSVLMMEDETARVRASRQFEADQRLASLRLMAGGIAHDFNNLLQGVIGNAELIELNLQGDLNHTKRLLRDLIAGGQKAAGLSHKLLAYSGRAHIKVEDADLNELVSDVLDFMRIDVSPQTTTEVMLASEALRVRVDPVQVAEIVFNLLTNAYEAVRQNHGLVSLQTGEVMLDLAAIDSCQVTDGAVPGNYCYLRVTDNGPGLAPATLARIFEPFYSTKELGRGLGLAAVSGIVAGHGGALRVVSAPGAGAEFVVYLKSISAT